MKTNIRQIGNSKGLIIPASILAQTGVVGEVDMSVKDQTIVISPVSQKKRDGWYDNYQASQDIDAWEGFVPFSSEDDEWVW